jgi:hypothetical protein
MAEYRVNFLWDEEAAVWVATSDEIPGLVLESGSLDALMERVRYAAPELLALNSSPEGDFSLHFLSERHEFISWKIVQWTIFGFDRKTNVPVARL